MLTWQPSNSDHSWHWRTSKYREFTVLSFRM